MEWIDRKTKVPDLQMILVWDGEDAYTCKLIEDEDENFYYPTNWCDSDYRIFRTGLIGCHYLNHLTRGSPKLLRTRRQIPYRISSHTAHLVFDS